MEWLAEDTERGQAVLTIAAVLIAGSILWFGRKRLRFAVAGAIAFLVWAAIAIPGFIPAGVVASRNACISNLRTLDRAKEQWALEMKAEKGVVATMKDLSEGEHPFVRVVPQCPRGGIYSLGAVGEVPECTLEEKGHRL